MPVLVPFGHLIGANTEQIGAVVTINMFGRILSNQFLPWLSDKTSRKATIILSMVGSLVGYTFCGGAYYAVTPEDPASWNMAHNVTASIIDDGSVHQLRTSVDSGYYTFVVGKLIGGLFGATIGLITAYVIELSVYDTSLLKTRQSLLMSFNMAAPMLLAPIGGAVSTYGLQIPFIIAAAVAFLGVLFSLRYMHDVKEIRALQAAQRKKTDEPSDNLNKEERTPPNSTKNASKTALPKDKLQSIDEGTAGERDPEAGVGQNNTETDDGSLLVQEEDPVYDGVRLNGNPCTDTVLITQSIAYFLFGTTMTMREIVTPLCLYEPSFGIMTSGGEKAETVAQTVGLLSLPLGICQVFMNSVGYIYLSGPKIGWSDRLCILVGGTIMALAMGLCGVSTQLYQLFLCFSLGGAGTGLFMGGFVNVPSIYVAKYYPKRISQARSCPLTFMYAGMMCGSLLGANIFKLFGVSAAWFAIAVCTFIPVCVLVFFTTAMISTRLAAIDDDEPAREGLTAEQLEILRKSDGLQPAVFMEQMSSDLEEALNERNYYMWSGDMQRLVKKAILQALPPLQPWDDNEVDEEGIKKPGFSFLKDVTLLHAKLGNYERIKILEEKFNYDLHSHLDGLDFLYARATSINMEEMEEFSLDSLHIPNEKLGVGPGVSPMLAAASATVGRNARLNMGLGVGPVAR